MRVKLQYFKPSGKYYTSGEYVTTKKHMHEIFEEVQHKLLTRTLPGLVQGHSGFTVYVRAPEHVHDYPALITP